MIDTRAMRAALVAIALVNMVPAIEAEESWTLLTIVALTGLVGLFTWRNDQRRGVPAVVVYCGVVAAICFLIFEMFFPPEGTTVYVLDLAHFMILLCGCKFLELRTDRDLGLCAIIAGLVLVIGAFVSGSILFGIAVLVDITFGVWWLLAFQMRREFQAVARRTATARAALKLPATVERSSALYRPAILIGMGMCSAAIMLFVAVPRGWGRTMLGSIQRVMPTSLTGFSDEVELTGAPLVESDVQIMRVRFSREGKPIVDEDFQAYMLGATLEQYFKGRWQRTVSRTPKRVFIDSKSLPATLSPARTLFPPHELVEQEVWLERTDGGVLFAIYPAVAMGSEMIPDVRANDRDQTITTRHAGHGMLNYVVESPVKVTQRAIRPLDSLDEHGQPLPGAQSKISEKIKEVARSIADPVGDSTDPADHEKIVKALMGHLNASPFVYSLDPGTRGAKVDPIENFLTSSHRGHCEYFASALTLMCQSLDIPARLATGYYGGEVNPVGAYYQFRARDAHAWVEIFLPGQGWTVFDPSPAAGNTRRSTELGLLSELTRLAGYLQFEWSTFVVAFDSDHRQELVMGFLNWLAGLTSGQKGATISWRTVGDFFWGPDFLSKGQRAVYWVFLLLCAAMLIAALRVLWIVGILVRELLPRRRQGGAAAPVRVAEARFYDRVLHLLARKGHVKADRETPREFAVRLKLRHLDLADMPDITEMFYAAQYGARTLGADARDRVTGFMQRLREEPGFGAR